MRRVIVFLIFTAALISAGYHLTQQASINYHQGHRFFMVGKYRPAVPFLEKSLEISPGNKEAILELGYSYLWTGSPDKAIPLLLESAGNFPKDKKILCGLADAYSWNKQYDEAIKILRAKILESGDILVKKKLAELYLWSGKYELSGNILEPMLKRDPEDQDALFMMGKVLYYSGKSQDATKVLEKLLEGMNER